MSFKVDDFFNLAGAEDAVARIFYARTGLNMDVNLLAIKDGKLVTYTDKAGANYAELFELTNDWVDVAFVFDWDRSDFNYTIYYGEDVTEDDAEKVAAIFAEKFDEDSVMLIPGGQPVYYYIISAE
jgi:dihydroxyacetone kinase-like predicted kinase